MNNKFELLENRIDELNTQDDITLYALGSNSCKSCKIIYLDYFLSQELDGAVAIDTFRTRIFTKSTHIIHDEDEQLSRIHIEGLGNQRKITLKKGKVVKVENITMDNYTEIIR